MIVLNSTLCSQVGQKETPPPCLNKRSFYFVDYILRCSLTVKKRFIRKLATAYYLDGIWHVSKPGTLTISLKGNKNRKPTDSKLINPSIASTGHQEGSTQKPFSEHLKRVKWMAPKKLKIQNPGAGRNSLGPALAIHLRMAVLAC